MFINIVNIGNRFNLYRNLYQLLYVSLTDLGHQVRVSDNAIEAGALNLIAPPMAFRLKQMTEAMIDGGVRYAVLGVELFDGFSHLTQPGPDQTDEEFKRFIGNAAAVLCLFRQDVPLYAPLTERALYLRYGFHPAVSEIPSLKERPIDVFFFGDTSAYPDRKRVLDTLSARGLRVVTTENAGASNAPDDLVRNSRAALAKVNLNIAHGRHASPQRVVYLANNGIMPLSDQTEDPDGYLEAARVFPDRLALIDGCLEACSAGRWTEDGRQAYEIAARHPMTALLEEALESIS